MQLFKPSAQLLCPPIETHVIGEPRFPHSLCVGGAAEYTSAVALLFLSPMLHHMMPVPTFPRVSSVGPFLFLIKELTPFDHVRSQYCKYCVRKTEILHRFSCLRLSHSAYFHTEQVKKKTHLIQSALKYEYYEYEIF